MVSRAAEKGYSLMVATPPPAILETELSVNPHQKGRSLIDDKTRLVYIILLGARTSSVAVLT